MTIEQLDVIDIVTINDAANEVRLFISDHLPWDVDEGEHLLLLQSKLNLYLHVIESGQLYEQCPRSIGRDVIIEIAPIFPLSAQAQRLFVLCQGVVRNAGFDLRIWNGFAEDDRTSAPIDGQPEGIPHVKH
ncbi:DUF6572 domain-containing protein [Methylocapsa sp. S129]|uniref:DUF6572 domain-containing protein n=1 Tax=Methylocapsa sp. S129 TaxID=1641869 RepID=UPI00131BD55F|nr:DUF6572 domain-containing protein [Methylocapsa sp. S129]